MTKEPDVQDVPTTAEGGVHIADLPIAREFAEPAKKGHNSGDKSPFTAATAFAEIHKIAAAKKELGAQERDIKRRLKEAYGYSIKSIGLMIQLSKMEAAIANEFLHDAHRLDGELQLNLFAGINAVEAENAELPAVEAPKPSAIRNVRKKAV